MSNRDHLKQKKPSNKELQRQLALHQLQTIYQQLMMEWMIAWVHTNAPEENIKQFDQELAAFSNSLVEKPEKKQIVTPNQGLILPGNGDNILA